MLRTVWKITLIGSSSLPVQKESCETGKLARFGKGDQQIPRMNNRIAVRV